MEKIIQKAVQLLITHITKEVIANINNELTIIREQTEVKKEYYSYKELSQITGLSINAIKGRRRRGTLKVVYNGITPLISCEEVQRLLNKLKQQQQR